MLLNQITQQLKALSLDSASTSYLDKTCVQNINSESDSDNSEEEEEESFNELGQKFEDSSIAVTKFVMKNTLATRNYYTKPTPPDLQFEERGTFATNHFRWKSRAWITQYITRNDCDYDSL